MMKRAGWVLAILLAAMTAVRADDTTAEQPAPTAEVSAAPGAGARAWLELQRSGSAASEQRQPLSGAAMDKVHERYVKSFGHPQPEQFKYDEPISK